MAATLGLDFGTSNSAAGIAVDGKPLLIAVEAGETTLPTSVFFDFDKRGMLFGRAANAALIEGREGRFMRSLKSVLGTGLMHEPRRMMGETLTFVDIIARFLGHVKTQAEAQCGEVFTHAVSGRPVRFHSANEERNQQALADLNECYRKAGFEDVRFLNEPEAAALANGAMAGDGIGLIVDIGGGTSDFSLFRQKGQGVEVLASYGIRLGGTNFDTEVSVEHVMPLFGRSSMIGQELGSEVMAAPKKIFRDLATWEKIPFLYAGEVRREVGRLKHLAEEPALFARLAQVLEYELGHDVAFAVEAGKIAANGAQATRIELNVVQAGLGADMSRAQMDATLAQFGADIGAAALATLAQAGVAKDQVERVIFVGGSSLMTLVSDALGEVLPAARQDYSDVFTGVVDGLALASGRV